MKVIINHVTRMGPGYICVAGFCRETASHVRLLEQVGLNLPVRYARQLRVGLEVDIGEAVECAIAKPHVEDCLFTPEELRVGREVSEDEFWALLTEISRPNLRHVFGDELMWRGDARVLWPGQGIASLGCLRPGGDPVLGLDEHGPRMTFGDEDRNCNVAVNDLRFRNWAGGKWSLNGAVYNSVKARLRSGTPCILSLGLTRPFRRYCWLQVNGVYFEDSPLRLVLAPTTP